MAFVVDEQGNITCYQGDSGELTVNGLPTDKAYTVYFAVQDEKRNPVGDEISVNANRSPVVTFVLTADLTDLWEVKKNQDTATYYYGVKICDAEGKEDTLVIDGSDFGEYSTITVYPKKVEGIING